MVNISQENLEVLQSIDLKEIVCYLQVSGAMSVVPEVILHEKELLEINKFKLPTEVEERTGLVNETHGEHLQFIKILGKDTPYRIMLVDEKLLENV